MKNNTKIRLHLSKQLFESLTKQVIAEGKGNMSGGAYTEAVKQPKMKTEMKSKKEEGMKHKMEESNLSEDMTSAQAGLKAITDFFGAVDPETAVALLATVPGALLGTAMTLMGKAKQKKEKQGGGKEAGLDEDMTSASTDLDVTADDVKKAFNVAKSTSGSLNESLTDIEMILTAGFTSLGFASAMAAAMASDAIKYMKANNLKGFKGALQAIKKVSSSFAKSAAKRNPQTGAIEK